MKKFILVCILLMLTPSCSSLNPLSFLNDDPKLEVNANVGKNVEQEKSKIKVETGTSNQTADTISNDTTYQAKTVNQITQDIPPYIIGLLILGFGWIIPDPRICYNGVKWIIKDIAGALIITPIKAVADFILKLRGK